MRCSSTDKGLSAVCRCGGTTVFDGATIGQVFTGHVEMTCPIAAEKARQVEHDIKRQAGSGPLATALLAIAIWQAWLALPIGGALPSSQAMHAMLFLCGGTAAKYIRADSVRVALWRGVKAARRFGRLGRDHGSKAAKGE